VKSRARENRILYNRIMDEADGTSSYVIDLRTAAFPTSSETSCKKDQRRQFDDGDLWEEGLTNPDHGLYIVNNTFVNNFGSARWWTRAAAPRPCRTICSSVTAPS